MKKRHIAKMIIAGALMLAAAAVYAATGYSVGSGGTTLVDEWGTCQNVTNNNGASMFIPTNSSGEWTAFRNNAQGVSLSSCAINGGWSGWSGCSASCGSGSQTRACNSPSPAYGGADCVGPSSQSCNLGACSVPGCTDPAASNYNSGATVNDGSCSYPPPDPTTQSPACFYDGTWVYHDQGGSSNGSNGNDFGVTCRSGKVTGWCEIDSVATGLDRGVHSGDYRCEGAAGMACDFDGTWSYTDDGSGNDFALSCRSGVVSGFCPNNTSISRGYHPGSYSCDGGSLPSGLPYCSYDGSWSYTDEGSGNDFAITCRGGSVTGWCGNTPYNRGSHGGSYSCESAYVPPGGPGGGGPGGGPQEN